MSSPRSQDARQVGEMALRERIAAAIASVRNIQINEGEPTIFDYERADAVLAVIAGRIAREAVEMKPMTDDRWVRKGYAADLLENRERNEAPQAPPFPR